MTTNNEILDYIYQNTAMGINTINQVKEKVEDLDFYKQLDFQMSEYTDIHNTAKAIIIANGKSEKDLSAITKIKTYIMININLIPDSSIKHIAEMMIQGSNAGIIDCTKHVNEYQNGDNDVLKLLKKLLAFEQTNIERLKKYL